MGQRAILCLVWVFGTLGAAGIVASCVTTYWQEHSLGLHEGLWQYCNKLTGCSDIKIYSKNEKAERNAVKALMVIGIVVIGITNIVNVVGTCLGKNTAVPLIVLEVVAIGCVAASLGLATSELQKPTYDWGWSYMVGWAGVGLYAVSFIFLCVAVCQQS